MGRHGSAGPLSTESGKGSTGVVEKCGTSRIDFRATDENSLFMIYQEIDRLEKTEMEVTTIKRYSEEYYHWISLAVFFLLLEFSLRYTVFRSIP